MDVLLAFDDGKKVLDGSPLQLGHEITRILSGFRAKAERDGVPLPGISCVLVGTEEEKRYVAWWCREKDGWKSTCRVVTLCAWARPEPQMAVFGPEGIPEARAVLKNEAIPLLDRIRKVCGMYATAFPKMVNETVNYRMDPGGFVLRESTAIMPERGT